MMGWSRGAVTCIRIAHFLNLVPQLAKIPVIIFAVDPVAGHGHDDEKDAYTLGGNVSNYVATLAMHENRSSFSPMELSRLKFGTATRVAVLPMPGHHADTAEAKSMSGNLTFHLCHTFLGHHGTGLHAILQPFRMTSEQVLRACDKLLGGGGGVHWKGQGIGKLIAHQGGDPFGHSRDVVKSHDLSKSFFINAHHQAVFRSRFAQTFNAYFASAGPPQGKNGQPAAQIERQQIESGFPAHARRLSSLRPGSKPAFDVYLCPQFDTAVRQNGLV